MGVFFAIALFIYLFYVSIGPNTIVEEPLSDPIMVSEELAQEEPQIIEESETTMTQGGVKIQASTDVTFEIVDQFGLSTKIDRYNGMNWLGYTKLQMSQLFPDYVMTEFEKSQVTLTRVMERKVEPNYVLSTQGNNIVICTEKDGHKMYYKETGLGQHDFSEKLGKALEKGIPITPEEKDAILENADELYKILQEYDE